MWSITDMKIDVPVTIEQWRARGMDYLPGTLGMEFVRVEPTLVIARLEIDKAVLSWNGFLHAGTVVSLADTCCGYGTLSSLPEGADGFTTIDLTSNFIGTARDGVVTCEARPLHQGRSTQIWDATVHDEATAKPIAHFRCSQMVLWPRD